MKQKQKLTIKPPKKSNIDKYGKIIITFVFILVFIATLSLVIIFWDNIVNFLSTGLTLFLLIGIAIICIAAPILISKKVLNHDDDEF